MANLPFFWQAIVVALTIAGLMYLLFLGIMIYFAEEPVHHEVMWDETLEEGQAPVPAWWFWSGISAAIFALLYMTFYPSFGNYRGLFNNALLSESYVESQAKVDHDYYQELEKLEQSDIVTLQFNEDAMKLARNTFAQSCATCHADDAKGQTNFPDLTDQAWIWGGTPEQITHSIAEGRKAVMPAWGVVLGEEGVDNVAKYVKSIADNTYKEKEHTAGKAKYLQMCAGCHTPTMQGNPIFGAPNLGDSAWIYGGDLASIKQSIAKGRSGVMPAHKDRLTELQIKLLVAWLSRNN
ncbi:MAG: Cbb3-type cytochrome c oxidase subunit CcoP2 [Catillopecten margaritatus gill symbiont]|uniref:Cbb3-type cytochrome c oxidase subunit n=1 Tax=Catillopecten margaritatus gill symbiont TaxID=3083288 RepID=A0AAU6PH88_9GAMM